jgi:hypothetical protein
MFVPTIINIYIYTHTETTRIAKRVEQATTGSAEDHTEIAKNLNICTDGPGATQDENWVLGFHTPPFQSVQHLHLHCIAPPVQIFNTYIYIYISVCSGFTRPRFFNVLHCIAPLVTKNPNICTEDLLLTFSVFLSSSSRRRWRHGGMLQVAHSQKKSQLCGRWLYVVFGRENERTNFIKSRRYAAGNPFLSPLHWNFI